jgi:hypothetical protein
MGPRAGLDVCEKFATIRIRSPDRPVRSQSLYQLSYRPHFINASIYNSAHHTCEYNHLPNLCNHFDTACTTTPTNTWYHTAVLAYHTRSRILRSTNVLYLQHLLVQKPEDGHCSKAETCNFQYTVTIKEVDTSNVVLKRNY